MPLGTLDRTPAAVLPPGAVGADQAGRLLGAGALPDGGRRALRLRRAAARARWPRRCCRCSAPCACRCEIVLGGGGYLRGLQQAQAEAEPRPARSWPRWPRRRARAEQLARRTQRLRALLDLARRPRAAAAGRRGAVRGAPTPTRASSSSTAAQAQGVAPGAPVIDAAGVLGQVTRVYPLSAEVTLLTDQDAAIPVLNLRTQQRARRLRRGARRRRRAMELRFMSANADVQVGDVLHTSGLDGVYPPGLPVAARAQRSSAAPRAASRACCWRRRHRATACATCWCSSRCAPCRPPPRARPRGRGRRRSAGAGTCRGAPAPEAPRHDHAAAARPAAAAGQPAVHRAHAAAGAGRQPAAAGPPARPCRTCWRWCWCSGTCTSRAGSASASPSASAC